MSALLDDLHELRPQVMRYCERVGYEAGAAVMDAIAAGNVSQALTILAAFDRVFDAIDEDVQP